MIHNTNKVLLSIYFSIALISLVSCTAYTTAPPLPVLNITPPSPDVPPEIAAFIGIWEGKWGGAQDTIIVVEKINNQKADLILSRGHLGMGGYGFINSNSYDYITASVLSGSIIEWRDDTKPSTNPDGHYQCPCKLTLELTGVKDILIAYWEYTDYNFKKRADLRRRK